MFSVKRFVTGSRAPQPLHTTFTVSYPAAAMPVASSASAISRMFASVTVASPENWFQLCQCIGGYGAISAAGRGATLAAGAPEAAGAPATDSSAVATRLLMVVAEEFQSSVPDVQGLWGSLSQQGLHYLGTSCTVQLVQTTSFYKRC